MSPSAERRRSCGCRGTTPAARIRARTEWPPGTESSGGGPLGAGPCQLVGFGALLAGGVGSDVGLDEGLVDAPASPHQRAPDGSPAALGDRSEEHTSELQSPCNLVCRLLLEKKKKK